MSYNNETLFMNQIVVRQGYVEGTISDNFLIIRDATT